MPDINLHPFVCPNGHETITTGDPYIANLPSRDGIGWQSSFKPDSRWRCTTCFQLAVRRDSKRIITGADEQGNQYRITIEALS